MLTLLFVAPSVLAIATLWFVIWRQDRQIKREILEKRNPLDNVGDILKKRNPLEKPRNNDTSGPSDLPGT